MNIYLGVTGKKNVKSSFKKYALISKNQYIKCGIYEKEKKNEKKGGAMEMQKRGEKRMKRKGERRRWKKEKKNEKKMGANEMEKREKE